MSLNHAGTEEDNPILNRVPFRIQLHKQGSSETLRKCYVTVGEIVFSDLTGMAVSSDTLIYVDVTAGVHLQSAVTPVRNIIHFTTSGHRHSKMSVWVMDQPMVKIALDGYNAENAAEPLIWPIYSGS